MMLHLADVALLAVWVPHTLWAAASDGVRLGDEAGLAGADRVTCNMVGKDNIYCLLSIFIFIYSPSGLTLQMVPGPQGCGTHGSCGGGGGRGGPTLR